MVTAAALHAAPRAAILYGSPDSFSSPTPAPSVRIHVPAAVAAIERRRHHRTCIAPAAQLTRVSLSLRSSHQQPLRNSQPPRSREPHRQHSRVALLVTAATKPTAEQQVASELPDSKEQSIQQAASSLAAQLPKDKGGKGGKGPKAGGIKRLAVDVPVADQSASAAVQLVREVLDELPAGRADAFTLIFGDPAAEQLASQQQRNPAMAVDANFDGSLEGPLLIVGATQAQVADVQEMLYGWRGGLAVLLNAEWDAEATDAELASFVRSFDTIYCFGPLEIQGFFSKKEGCVFKWVKKGSPSATPWHILSREGSEAWQVVGRQQRRPTPGDMELAFYNAAAATSPITKGVKFVRGLTGGNK